MFAFSARKNAWVKRRAHRGNPVDLKKFKVATYNVWFDPFESARRCEAVLDILERELPDLVALEEVTALFLEALLARDFVRGAYRVSCTALPPDRRYDVVMLSRVPVRSFKAHTLPTSMGRRLHTMVVPTPRGDVAVAGTHLESMRDRTPVRLAQITETIKVLTQSDAAVWLGDFNAAPESEEDGALRTAFRDAWDELSSDPGYTRDTSQNAMLAKVKQDRRQRIDRVLLRGEGIVAHGVKLLGTEPLPGTEGQVFPSDHFGLLAELAIT
jgi:poly(A) polymerase